MIPGYATEEGTTRFSQKFPHLTYKELSNTTLKASEIGFGSYRIDDNIEAHHLALKKAINKGINIIDTSSNYSDGNSEKLIAQTINSLIENKNINRDEIIIVTKAGYIQGQNYQISQRKKQQGKPFEDLVEYAENLEHCISPDFLKEQLTMSLMRLDMNSVDFFLLHNPEYYLVWAKKNNINKQKAKEIYYERIQKAFICLEEEVRKGRISFYGISSNTFPKNQDDFEATSIKKILEIAENISPYHRFKLIQFPMNLFECSPAFEQSISINAKNENTRKLTLLEYITEKNIASLVNRPLNVLLKDKILRLADVSVDSVVTDDKINKFIADMIESEAKFKDTFIHTIDVDSDTKTQLIEYLLVGKLFQQYWKEFKNYTQWYDVFSRYFTPRINSAIHLLKDKELSQALSYWLDNYVNSIERVFRTVDSHYKIKADNDNTKIKQIVKEELPDTLKKINTQKLTNIAINTLRATKSINSILVGMRQEIYVDDMLENIKDKIKKENNKSLWTNLDKKLSSII